MLNVEDSKSPFTSFCIADKYFGSPSWVISSTSFFFSSSVMSSSMVSSSSSSSSSLPLSQPDSSSLWTELFKIKDSLNKWKVPNYYKTQLNSNCNSCQTAMCPSWQRSSMNFPLWRDENRNLCQVVSVCVSSTCATSRHYSPNDPDIFQSTLFDGCRRMVNTIWQRFRFLSR